MNMVRIVFEERERTGPNRHYRDYGMVQTIGEAVLRATALVRKESFACGLFEIHNDIGDVLGTLTVDLHHEGARFHATTRAKDK